jgi:peptidoglycan-associated lipoprotein
MVKSYLKVVAVGVMMGAVLMVSGCSSKKVAPADAGVTSSPAAEAPEFKGEGLDAQASDGKSAFTILEGRTTGPMLPIYFDFDKSNVRKDQKSRMETNASYLKDNPSAVIAIEGNCDERGTNEYNMALGERRALAAKKYLGNMGVDASRLTTISYGEEKPLNFGHDELAWSQNRRDDFVQNQ